MKYLLKCKKVIRRIKFMFTENKSNVSEGETLRQTEWFIQSIFRVKKKKYLLHGSDGPLTFFHTYRTHFCNLAKIPVTIIFVVCYSFYNQALLTNNRYTFH